MMPGAVIGVLIMAGTLSADTVQAIEVPEAVLGPYGLLVAALIAIGVLWRDHQAADRARNTQLDVALSGWRDQTDATRELTAELQESNRLARRRQTRTGA